MEIQHRIQDQSIRNKMHIIPSSTRTEPPACLGSCPYLCSCHLFQPWQLNAADAVCRVRSEWLLLAFLLVAQGDNQIHKISSSYFKVISDLKLLLLPGSPRRWWHGIVASSPRWWFRSVLPHHATWHCEDSFPVASLSQSTRKMIQSWP